MIMSPGLRKFVLALHLATSVGWVGAIAAYLPFDLVAATSQDAQTLRAAWIAMRQIAQQVIIPLALATLVTGLLISLGTKWGLIRHWWVLISLVLTAFATLVLLSEVRLISRMAGMAADPAISSEALRTPGGTLLHSVGGLLVLLVVHVLNIYKPAGLTRYGWRKQQEEMRERRERGREGQLSEMPADR